MMMIVIVMMIASYTNDNDCHRNDDCIVHKWWWSSSRWWPHRTWLMIVTIILTASYIGDDVASYMHWLYAMRYFSVTDGRTDKEILGVGWSPYSTIRNLSGGPNFCSNVRKSVGGKKCSRSHPCHRCLLKLNWILHPIRLSIVPILQNSAIPLFRGSLPYGLYSPCWFTVDDTNNFASIKPLKVKTKHITCFGVQVIPPGFKALDAKTCDMFKGTP